MAEKRDYYETLGVQRTATKDEIKSAYRKLAMKYHPDRNKEPGAEKKFMEVQEAYDVLYDDQKRKTFDQFGSAAFDQNGSASGFGGGNPFQGGFGNFGDLNDIFSQMFGGGMGGGRNSQRNGPNRGDDTLMRVKVSFIDAIMGKKITIPVTYDKVCDTCNGTGAKSSSDIKTCSHCGGSGYVRTTKQTLFGAMESETTCPYCGGTGKIIANKCPDCGGTGSKRVKENIDIAIPAGINAGQQIRVKGKGMKGSNGGSNGDLYIEIVIQEDNIFKRDGNDIHLNLEIDFVDAALGISMDVKTVYDTISLKIPAGSQPNTVLKLSGKGIKDMRNGRPGDEYVHIIIKTPTNLNTKQKECLNDFKINSNSQNNPFSRFKDKLKK
ncbi:MAG: molecular chaperone DnaJ [Bacilli bacterium]